MKYFYANHPNFHLSRDTYAQKFTRTIINVSRGFRWSWSWPVNVIHFFVPTRFLLGAIHFYYWKSRWLCRASLARLRNAMQNFSKEFSSAPPSGSGSSRAYSRDSPSSRFSIYLFFFFFFTTCYVIPRSNFPRFFPCPDFHGFLDIAGSTTFFFPSPLLFEDGRN